jgi:glycosyltransferase involved in cell wall biosynthesis
LGVNALNPNNITSSQVFARMQELVKKYDLQEHVMFVTDFLDAAEVIRLLQLSDVALMPYDPLGEGSSGATRAVLSASRPVIITHSHIFSNLKNVGYRIADNKPESIAAAVTKFFEDSVFYSKQKQQVRTYIQANSWEKSSREYLQNF